MAFVQIEDLYGGIEMLVFPKVLAEFGHLLKEGSVVQLKGRVSAREEEEPKNHLRAGAAASRRGKQKKKSRRPGALPSDAVGQLKGKGTGCAAAGNFLKDPPRCIFTTRIRKSI